MIPALFAAASVFALAWVFDPDWGFDWLAVLFGRAPVLI